MRMTSSTPSPSESLVVVTGASSGIGLEVALCAARDGHPVLLVARGVDALEKAADAAIDAGSPAAHVVGADLSTSEGIDTVVAAVDKLGMPVAALVNNAGFGGWGPFVAQDVDRSSRMVDLNCRAVVELSRRLHDRVRDARGGVLTVASTAAFQPGPGMAVYHASKAFALYFSLALRDELKADGVRVTALCPGPVPTEFGAAAGVDEALDSSLRVKLSSQPADKVARLAWRGLKKNQAIVMPGTVNRIGALGAKLAPLTTSTRLARTALGAMATSAKA